jgi:hypothetical protein
MSIQPEGFQPEGYQPEGYQPEYDSGAIPEVDVRFEFRSRRGIHLYPSGALDDEYTFMDAVKDPGETIKVRLDLYNQCAHFWRDNESFEQNEYIRPNRANGYAYRCSVAGTSGAREPKWPQTVGATVRDGSATWTCVAAGSFGLNAITDPSGTSDPTGLTISDVSVSEDTKILSTYSGGSDGEDFDAVFSFTLNGVPRVARQKVCIRKR